MRIWPIECAFLSVTSPNDAMHYSAKTILDPAVRTAVLAALPTINIDDFAEAARQIRERVEGLR